MLSISHPLCLVQGVRLWEARRVVLWASFSLVLRTGRLEWLGAFGALSVSSDVVLS